MPHNMELRMYFFHRMILVSLLTSVFYFHGPQTASAQALEIVFKDSLWGSAIGSVVGLASWSLQDTDKDDKLFPKYVVRGAAFGVFVGMAYGVYDVNRGGDVFMSKSKNKGLIHYHSGKNLLSLRLHQLLPLTDFFHNQTKLRLNLFTASF